MNTSDNHIHEIIIVNPDPFPADILRFVLTLHRI
jgi:hypothetical protein